PIRCRIDVTGGALAIDFAGSSPQVKGAINSTLSFVKSASYLAVRCARENDLPNKARVNRCNHVTAPQGSVLNPVMPAPVVARALTGYRVVDTVMGALAQIVPERVRAAGEGGNTVVAFGGYHTDTRQPFVMVDMINGAWGGACDRDGVDGVTNPSQNMSNLPVETTEARYPLRIDSYGFRPDSGGAGRHRGGLGLARQYTLLADRATLQVRADRATHRPYGLEGGAPGAASENYLVAADGTRQPMPSKFTLEVEKGQTVLHWQAGAGGYGDPLERDPLRVREDVEDGKISLEAARRDYGVLFAKDGRTLDAAATEAHRAQLRGARAEEAAQ
ncbi:MAG: hydantoinase B/oxoprolinase family protein, partial [Roseovarius sp.]